jgi:hypothetical protein
MYANWRQLWVDYRLSGKINRPAGRTLRLKQIGAIRGEFDIRPQSKWTDSPKWISPVEMPLVAPADSKARPARVSGES